MDKYRWDRRGTHKGIRLITSIDSHTVNAIEDFIASLQVEVKHVPSNSKQFVVSNAAAHVLALDYRLNVIPHRLIHIKIFLNLEISD